MRHSNLTLFIALFFAALTSIGASAQELPFKGGENLSYKLHYKWGVINADIAKLDFNVKEETYQGTPCFRLVTKGATSNLAASIVKVKYLYDSRFSRDGLAPLSFYREQTEGSYWAKNSYSWENNGRRLKAHVEKSTRGVRDTVFTSKSVIYDVITTLYGIRAADLDAVKNGGKLNFVAALDRNLYDINVKFVKSEDKRVGEMGVMATDKFVMNIRRREGGERLDKESSIALSSKDSGALSPIYLWITPDQTRTIVAFSTGIAVGAINGRLVSASGLKSPLPKPVK